ncbi:hypothetical protein ACERNI_05395 [Camelimonas sp. ID_303_24]
MGTAFPDVAAAAARPAAASGQSKARLIFRVARGFVKIPATLLIQGFQERQEVAACGEPVMAPPAQQTLIPAQQWWDFLRSKAIAATHEDHAPDGVGQETGGRGCLLGRPALCFVRAHGWRGRRIGAWSRIRLS